jgi:hypothetical protein
MVRNAGGRVFDALRTLAVLQTIGAAGTIAVMHHTGMPAASNVYLATLTAVQHM